MDELQLFRGDTVLLKGKKRKETVSCLYCLSLCVSSFLKLEHYCCIVRHKVSSNSNFVICLL